jgi:ADP-ribose pyrophosphatase YjhB (NUDIX family)
MASTDYTNVVDETATPAKKQTSVSTPKKKKGKGGKKEISLREFLTFVSNNVSTINNINNLKQDSNAALTAIIKACNAKKFVGAAVGGLLINHEKEEVLLYLRPKEPEKYKWSMPGGSIEFENDATKALINEYEYITGIKLKPGDLLPLRITNHIVKESSPCKYHYLSPAFTVKNPNDFLCEINAKINKTKKLTNKEEIKKLATDLIQDAEESTKIVFIDAIIEDIQSENYFLKEWERELKNKLSKQSYKYYIVKWFKIDDVINTDKISEPTKSALKSYQRRINTIDNVAKEADIILQKATEDTHKTIDNVAKEADTILQKATEDTHKKIKEINLEFIIETDV